MNGRYWSPRVLWVSVCLMLVVALVVACAPVAPAGVSAQPAQEGDVEEVTAEIEAAFDEYATSLGEGDAERWIQLWTEDGVQSPPGAPPNVGREMIYTSIAGAMEVFAFDNMQIDIDEVLVAGDLAIARGLYTVTYVPHDGSAPIPVDGKYTSTFQRQADGSWKLYRDIFNSNVPAAAPAEPDVEAVTAAIEDIFAEYADSLNEGDAERWIALWAEESVQSSPDAPPNVGRDVIYEGIRSEVEQLDYQDMVIEVEEVLTAGDFAVARGMYSLTVAPIAGGDPIPVDGKYTTTFQRQPDGSWKIFRDIYNSNVPPAAPAEPDMEEVAAEVQAFWDEYARTNVAGDLEGWINLWDEAGVKMIDGHPPIVGRDTVRAFKQAASEKLDVTSMSITNQDVELSGDLATVRGIYEGVKTPKDGSAPIIIDGWYSSVLKRDADGSWKLLWDTCASNVPPATAAEPDMDEVAAQVQALWDEYAAANMAGDSERWIALWADGGVKMSDGAPPLEGTDNILARKQASNEKWVTNDMSITNLEVEVAGDWAFVRGIYDATRTPMAGGDSVGTDGWYMSILKQQPDDSWKLYRDAAASAAPPPAPPEPDMEEVAAEVQAFWDEYSAANMAGDSERWIALWTDGGVKMSDGAPPLEGTENILARKQASNEKWVINDMSITNLEVEVAGDWAFVRGVYDVTLTPAAGGDTVEHAGWYMSILQQQPDGSWKLYRDAAASAAP